MKNFTKILVIATVFALLLTGANLFSQGGTDSAAEGGKVADDVTWKFTTVGTRQGDKLIFDVFEKMAARFASETNGQVKLELYQLGEISSGEVDFYQSVQLGDIQLAQMSASVLSGLNSSYNVLSLPFLFDDKEHMDRWVATAEGQEFLKLLENQGIYTFNLSLAGFFNPNTKKPIRVIADCKGVKWRTMQVQVQLDTMKALGAVPIPLPFGEVYTALKTGVVEAWNNTGTGFMNISTPEVAPYVTKIPLFGIPTTLIINKKAFDSLSPNNQTIVRKIIDESFKEWTEILYQMNVDKIDELRPILTEIIEVTDIKPWVEAVSPVYGDLVRKTPEAKKYVDSILASR